MESKYEGNELELMLLTLKAMDDEAIQSYVDSLTADEAKRLLCIVRQIVD